MPVTGGRVVMEGREPPRGAKFSAEEGGELKPRQRRRKTRRSSQERRREIAEATLSLISRVGLHNTTVSRIADEVGMQPPSLYKHFASRHEMLLAASALLHERAGRHLQLSSNPDILARLREITEAHRSYMSSEFEGFVIPIFEFMAAPRDSGLSELSGERSLDTVRAIADLIEEGQRQGTVRSDLDARLAAWTLMVCYWAEDITQVMGIQEYLADGYSAKILERILRGLAPSGDDPSEGLKR
jgi:AcrR family transcriptional regulator